MKKQIISLFQLRTVVAILIFMATSVVLAQSNGDKLFMEGQALQKKQTVTAQNQAIKKFEAAKVVYTSVDKKKMCENQIAICNNNISSLKRVSVKRTKDRKETSKESILTFSKKQITFDGDKKGKTSIAITASSNDWNIKISEGIEGDDNFAKATKSSDAKSIDIEVEANPYTIERHQSVIVIDESLTDTLIVSQKGKDVTLSTNSNLVEFKLRGGSRVIEVYTNSDSIINSNNGLTWRIYSKPDWIETIVEVMKEKSVVGKGIYALKGIVSSRAKAATAEDVKTSTIKIVAQPLSKTDPSYSSGRKGELVFESQERKHTVTIIQQ